MSTLPFRTAPAVHEHRLSLAEVLDLYALPFADLLEPAIEIAERGYAVPWVVRQKWAMAAALPELTEQPPP